MRILGLPADESFVHFHDAHKLAEILIREPAADTHTHMPGRPIGAEAHHAVDLECADPFLAGEHEMDDTEPLAEGVCWCSRRWSRRDAEKR